MTNTTEKMPTILTDRKDMAQALNFGKYKVLTFDMDENKGERAAVTKQTINHGEMKYAGELRRGCKTADDGIYYLLGDVTMLTAHISVERWLQFAEVANCPVIKEGDEVAILVHSETMGVAFVQLVRALKPTPDYGTILKFENL